MDDFRNLRSVRFDMLRTTPKIIRSKRSRDDFRQSDSSEVHFAEKNMLQEEMGIDSISPRGMKPTQDNNICERKGISGLIPFHAAKVAPNKIYFGKKSFPESFKIGDFSEKNFRAEGYSDRRRNSANNAIHRMATRVMPPAWVRSSPGRSHATGSHR